MACMCGVGSPSSNTPVVTACVQNGSVCFRRSGHPPLAPCRLRAILFDVPFLHGMHFCGECVLQCHSCTSMLNMQYVCKQSRADTVKCDAVNFCPCCSACLQNHITRPHICWAPNIYFRVMAMRVILLRTSGCPLLQHVHVQVFHWRLSVLELWFCLPHLHARPIRCLSACHHLESSFFAFPLYYDALVGICACALHVHHFHVRKASHRSLRSSVPEHDGAQHGCTSHLPDIGSRDP